MPIIFGLLFFFSLLLMTLGLIRPAIFQWFMKKNPSRKFISVVFASIAFISFIGIGLTAPQTPSQSTKPEDNQVVTNSAVEPTIPTTETNTEPEQITVPVSDSSADPKPIVKPETNSSLYTIVSVTDGDTFKVSIDGKTETVRAIGIDTPETVDPRKPVQCFGIEASKRAKALLTGKRVQLQADPTQDNRDKYSRLLRYAWLEDGTFFNQKMIADGFAVEYTYNIPYKYQAEFKQAEKDARTAKLGLWADNACPQTQTNTNTSNPNPTPVPVPQSSNHTFYTSSYYSSSTYYCDTDEVWKSLSPKYLKSFSSEAELLAAYPSKKLHEPCK